MHVIAAHVFRGAGNKFLAAKEMCLLFLRRSEGTTGTNPFAFQLQRDFVASQKGYDPTICSRHCLPLPVIVRLTMRLLLFSKATLQIP